MQTARKFKPEFYEYFDQHLDKMPLEAALDLRRLGYDITPKNARRYMAVAVENYNRENGTNLTVNEKPSSIPIQELHEKIFRLFVNEPNILQHERRHYAIMAFIGIAHALGYKHVEIRYCLDLPQYRYDFYVRKLKTIPKLVRECTYIIDDLGLNKLRNII